jgi:hypothetical protein
MNAVFMVPSRFRLIRIIIQPACKGSARSSIAGSPTDVGSAKSFSAWNINLLISIIYFFMKNSTLLELLGVIRVFSQSLPPAYIRKNPDSRL